MMSAFDSAERRQDLQRPAFDAGLGGERGHALEGLDGTRAGSPDSPNSRARSRQ